MRGRRGLAVTAAALVAAGAASYAVSITSAHAQTALGGPGVAAAAVQIAAILLLAKVGAAGLFRRDRRTTSVLLLSAAVLGCLAVPAPEAVSNSVWFTLALATTGAFAPTLIGVALCWPAPARTLVAWVAVLALVPILLTGLVPTLLFDPPASGCADCAQNLIAITAAPQAHDTVQTAGQVAVIAWCALAALVLLVRLLRLPRTARPVVAPVLAVGLAIAVVTAGVGWHELSLPTVETDHFVQLSWLTTCGLAALLALAIAANSLVYRHTARRLARLVLDANQTPETLRALYAALLGDPDLELVLNPGDEAAPPGALRVVRDTTPVAEIRFAAGFADAVPRLNEAVRATALAVEYAAAQDLLDRREAVLVESRRRIVSTGDDTRYRIERNLHDGGQQRLVALALQLRALERRCDSPRDAARFTRARAELAAALDELRAIAHGLFPRALRDDGLQAALLEFRDRSPIAVTVRIGPLPPALSAEVSMAAYRLVTDVALGVTECADTVQVDITHVDEQLHVDIDATGPGRETISAATRHAADRFAVLAGHLSVVPVGNDYAVRGVLPCAP